MRLIKKLLVLLLPGAVFAAAAILLSQCLLRNLGNIISWIGGLVGMGESQIATFSAILGQLENAEIISPWLPAMLVCCGINLLIGLLIMRKRSGKYVINLGIGLLVAIPVVLWFTIVNGVMFGDMVQLLVPILQSGLL